MTSVTDSAGFSTAIADVDLEALFTSISNHVALAGNNVSLEMLQLAAEVYGPDVESCFDLAFSHDPLPFELQPGQQGRNTGATVAVAPQTRGWDAVTASELGMASEDQSSPLKYSFVGGQYQGLDTNLAEANALVLTGLVHDPVSGTDKRTLALVIRGTDQAADALFDYHNFGTHYAKFAPLVAALQNYLAANADGIQQVLISGHSLGSGVVPYFLQAFPDTASYTVRAYVDGPTGSEVDLVNSRIVNFVHAGMMFPAAGDHEGDNVPMLGEVSHGDYSNIGNTNVPNGQTGKQWIDGIIKGFPLLPSGVLRKTRDGSDILIDSDVPQPVPTSFAGLVGPQHNPNLYAADLAKLVRFANDDSSPFAGTDAALALKSGTVYQGPSVAIAVGQPDTAELGALTSTTTNFVDPSVYVGKPYASDINVYWRDDYVLGEANGTIHWDRPWTSSSGEKSFNRAEHVHVVDGGSTATLVVLQGPKSDYHFTTQMTGLGLEADLSWVDSIGHEHLIGQLYRVNPVLFLPTTISSSAAGADTTSAAEPQFMLHLDGSAVTVQTALAGQAALTVDPLFDYTDAGDKNLTITGSGLGDIIALGSGNNTVIETTGSNIIFIKDAATAGSNTIQGGDGYDTIVGGQGNDTIIGGSGITTVYYSGARSEYQITRLDGGALQIADPGIGTPEGTDTLSGVEFFRFADDTYEFSAPVIATTDVAAVYGQTFAASDLFAAVDSDGPILSYQLRDNTPDPTSGKWLLDGAPQPASQDIDVTAAQLAQIEFQSGFGTDSVSVRAFDGIDWSDWTPLTVASPINPTSLLIGVNLAGAEFASPYRNDNGQPSGEPNPGVFGTNYTYPTHAEIDYYAAKGMSVVRLPFLWERIQHTQSGPLDAAELVHLDDVVNYATGKGLKIEIELHDYGFGFGGEIGPQTPNSSFTDVWGKLAAHFTSNPGVIFGLMNEPHVQSAADWLVSANAAIAAIRSAGALQEILVPGSYWDGAWSWTTTDNATVIGTGVQDTAHNFAFEVHQYLDSDSSGTHPGVVSPTIGVERLTAITQWAEANSQRLFLGEIGVDTQATSLAALDNTLSYIKQHTDVWSGVTYWAGGPWWGPYMFSIEPQNVNDPSNYGDKPQMAILMARGADTAAASILENTTAVTSGMATDPDTGQTLSYLISGGADASKFTIGSTTGALSFITAPNFELPTDLGGNNVYDVIVQASDGHGSIVTQAIAVTVTDVFEDSAPSGFAAPTFELAAFGPNVGGWSSGTSYPRELADVNADGLADIVGFGNAGVWTSLATGNGHFAAPTFELAAFGPNAGGWSSGTSYPRELADVNADGLADIVGFGDAGVWTSLATGNGHFAAPTFELAAFGPNAGGWSSDDRYPRELADVNADGLADIVGFGDAGVWASLATGNGHFAAPTFELAAFGPNAGGWSSGTSYPRELADVNADGLADIVGFGDAGVWTSLATGNGHFAAPTFELAAFGPNAGGWSSDDRYPRELADVNADGLADIVGFGDAGVWASLATGNGHFAAPTFELAAFGPNAGGWSSDTAIRASLRT